MSLEIRRLPVPPASTLVYPSFHVDCFHFLDGFFLPACYAFSYFLLPVNSLMDFHYDGSYGDCKASIDPFLLQGNLICTHTCMVQHEGAFLGISTLICVCYTNMQIFDNGSRHRKPQTCTLARTLSSLLHSDAVC